MPVCCLKGCGNRTGKFKKNQKETIRFFSFPKDAYYANLWKKACKREEVGKHATVCSIHFLPSSYKAKTWVQETLDYYPSRGRTLKEDAIPTENLPSAEKATKIAPADFQSERMPLILSRQISDKRCPNSCFLPTPVVKGLHISETKSLPSKLQQDPEPLLETLKKSGSMEVAKLVNNVLSVSRVKSKAEGNLDYLDNSDKTSSTISEVGTNREENRLLKKMYQRVSQSNKILERKLEIKDKKIRLLGNMNKKYKSSLSRILTPAQIRTLLKQG